MISTNYDTIAAQYKQAKQQPWRMHIEHFTLFELLGDLHGKTVLDLACGEGFFTRFIKQAGASRVVGVDLSREMIHLAQAEESRRPLGIEYQVHDAESLDRHEQFDVVVAAYLLNYAQTRDQLRRMCETCARHLRSGCRFVAVNNNPAQPVAAFESMRKYGMIKSANPDLHEGSPITYTIFLNDGRFEIVNYYLSLATHEWALAKAGFREVLWQRPRVSPQGILESGQDYWSTFLEHPPVTFLECTL